MVGKNLLAEPFAEATRPLPYGPWRLAELLRERSVVLFVTTHLRCGVLPRLGHLRLDAITPQLVEQYKVDRLSCGLRPQSVNNELSVLGGCLRVAREWGRIPQVPEIRWLKSSQGPVRFLSPDEARRLVTSAGDPFLRSMIIVALHTGLRIGELLALHADDVDLERRILTVRRTVSRGMLGTPKNGRIRYIPVNDAALAAFRNIRVDRGFIFSRGGHDAPMSENTARKALIRFAAGASLPRIGWHALRHTFASTLVSNGVPLPAVQQLLGHATIVMTMRYAHLAASALVQAVACLDGLPRYSGHPVGNNASESIPEPTAATTRMWLSRPQNTVLETSESGR